jgi:hypothetical protein
MRALRQLEPPSTDEGLASVERAAFVRAPSAGRAGACVFVGAQALRSEGWEEAVATGKRDVPHLVFDWRPDGSADDLEPSVAALAKVVTGPVRGAVCPHPGGPPTCWCRPPLPGLALAFAYEYEADPGRSILVGTSPAHRTLATTLGTRYISV